MPGQFVFEGGRASVVGKNTDNPVEIFENHVDPIKFVHNVFIDIDGSAEVWCELELGNHHDKPIRIDEVHIGFNNIGHGNRDVKNIRPATTSHTDLGVDRSPLLTESTPGGSQEKWHEMYDGYQLLDDDNPYFNHKFKDPEGNDRIFDYRLGPGKPHQHIFSVPVTFDVQTRLDDGDTTHPYILTDIRKLNNRGVSGTDSPVILPDGELNEEFNSPSRFDHSDQESINEPARRDTVSLWIYWEENDLCEPKDDISYHFRYAVDCDIPKQIFTRAYPHYILPDKSVLMGQSMLMESLSEHKIEEFHPPEEQWMFKEWEEKYNVRNMSSARMTRSKIKQQDHIFNSGRIGFPSLRARHTALQFVLVILSGWAVQSTFSKVNVTDLTPPSVPISEIWALFILPVSAYFLLKGYGPPPFFPSSLREYIVPTEEHLLSPFSNLLVTLFNLPGTVTKVGRSGVTKVRNVIGRILPDQIQASDANTSRSEDPGEKGD